MEYYVWSTMCGVLCVEYYVWRVKFCAPDEDEVWPKWNISQGSASALPTP